MGGVALPASELAYRAGVTNATASAHLKRLVMADLIRVTQSGRHRYYELNGPTVADLVETLQGLAPQKPRAPKLVATARLREARLCYDHLAGRVGVRLAESLEADSLIVRKGDVFDLHPAGTQFFSEFGVDMDHVRQSRRCFAKACIDWSERRPHLAGALGAAVTDRLFDLGWITRNRDDRSVTLTGRGASGLHRMFGIDMDS